MLKPMSKRLRSSSHSIPAVSISICLLLLFLTPVAGASEPQTAQRAEPRAVVPFTSYEFGEVYTGETISQIFIIRNEGTADLVVKEFKTGCSCSVTEFDRVIPPGKQGTATLEVNTISQFDEIYKSATLVSNDPERPNIVFSLKATVLRGAPLRNGKYIGPIFISDTRPSILAYPGKKATTEISITAEKPVKIVRVEGGEQYFNARIETVSPGKSYKVIIESRPLDSGNVIKERLNIITDNDMLPSFPIIAALTLYPKQ